MSERDEPFNVNGYCQACKKIAHDRVLDYEDLAGFFKQKVSTLKTWNSLQNAWLNKAHPNPEFALNTLRRAVNGRPAGAPMFLYVDYHGSRRTFRPLPPQIAPARWHGCVVAAFFYDGVLLGRDYVASDHIEALNQRKQIARTLPPTPRAPSGSPLRGSR